MSLKIKSNCDADNYYTLVSNALRSGGEVLNGATELNENGTYNAPNPGLEFYVDTFTLQDKWFNGQPQNIDTVIKAVEQATGIKLKFASQMLSFGPATIWSYEIVNQEKYEATVVKQVKFEAEACGGARVNP